MVDVPAEFQEAVEAARHALVDKVVEHDEALMEKYLAGEELTNDEIRHAIRVATCSMKFVPILCGASFKNKGVQALLDAVIDFLPSPVEVPAIEGHAPQHDAMLESREVSDDAPFSALAFKVATDPFVGRLTFIRVYSGVLKAGSHVYN
ncbi:MAG: elongation factor G, partial [Pyrinomonadaceae bacterium]|nr:elongation factor G [Pyrinomonadaceae bacterium]